MLALPKDPFYQPVWEFLSLQHAGRLLALWVWNQMLSNSRVSLFRAKMFFPDMVALVSYIFYLHVFSISIAEIVPANDPCASASTTP